MTDEPRVLAIEAETLFELTELVPEGALGNPTQDLVLLRRR